MEGILKKLYIATAFLEGISVLLIEIAGARALAPFFGASLRVWTAQITATLLCLAFGYGIGGWLSKKSRLWYLPGVFIASGFWLTLFPFLRVIIFETSAQVLGISTGSFFSALILFGPPLLGLGAVSPILIERLDQLKSGAGTAAGMLFFTNTIGGLVGGWITALVIIPHVSLRIALLGTGVALTAIGSFWAIIQKSIPRKLVAASGGAVCLLIAFTPPPVATFDLNGETVEIEYSENSSVGLLQVMYLKNQNRKTMLMDGRLQGGMFTDTGRSVAPYIDILDFLAKRYAPSAKNALVLGLGPGLLPKYLEQRGVQCTSVELEPKVGELALNYFGLPKSVKLVYQDARTFINKGKDKFDLVFLDVYAGENAPWHLLTYEALEAIHSMINPNGLLLVNMVSWSDGSSPGLARLESGLMDIFRQTKVFIDMTRQKTTEKIPNNVFLVAGNTVKVAFKGIDPDYGRYISDIMAIISGERDAQRRLEPGTDDWHDIDYTDSEVRLIDRRNFIKLMGVTGAIVFSD